MKTLQTSLRILGWSVAACWLLLTPAVLAAISAVEQPDVKGADCQLLLEGKHITKLELIDERGKTLELNHPGPSILLPAGRYQICRIRVEGGYLAEAFPWDAHAEDDRYQLVLTPGATCDPRIGAPLKPHLTVRRSGDLLMLDCRALCDGDGREYHSTTDAPPAVYIVYQGDRNLGWGTLKYG